MLTEAMRRAGWRECPSDEVRRAWEEKGGRWQTLMKDRDTEEPEAVIVRPGQSFIRFDMCARPVSTQTWDYDPRGWGVVVPTEPGLWWRNGHYLPVRVEQISDGPLFWWCHDDSDLSETTYPVEPDGHWIAPCVKPEVP